MAENSVDSDRDKEIADSAAKAETALNADILFANHYIGQTLDFRLYVAAMRRTRREELYFILVTEGGDAHTGYRCMRMLQNFYKQITIVIPGWCKSAGTLMSTGAQRLQMGPFGELGPLDVQIVRRDSLREVSSGLAVDTAVEKLQQEASKVLMNFIRDAEESDYRMSLNTASEIAKTVTVGLFAPVFAKLEPISIGEDYRAYKIAEAYAERLNRHAKNVQRKRDYDGLQALLEAFPSHGFVIDLPEAKSIFHRVDNIAEPLRDLIGKMGVEALFPLDREAGQNVIKYLSRQDRVVRNVSKKPAERKGRKAARPSRAVAGSTPARSSGASGDSKAGNGSTARK